MLTRFHIGNYKAIRDAEIALTPFHVLIGPNDSGKTSVLEAIAALCRSVDQPLASAFAGPWLNDQLVRHGAPEPVVTLGATIRLDDGNSELEYSFSCRFSGNRIVVLESESYTRPGEPPRQFPFTPRHVTHVGQFDANSPGRDTLNLIRKHLGGVQYYRWNPSFLSLPTAPDSKRRFRMEPSGFGLALCLDDILGYDRNRFAQLENRFKRVFPQVRSIKLISEPAYHAPPQDGDGAPVLMLQRREGKGLFFEFTDVPGPIPATQVSDGMLLVLAYLAILHLPKPPRMILIEEPENGIHPRRIQEVLAILRKIAEEHPTTQIVLTTHSPYVVDLFEPEHVSVCQKTPDNIVVRQLSESPAVREQLKVFTLGEIWSAEGDERLATEDRGGPER